MVDITPVICQPPFMTSLQSKLTSQSQISIPARIRQAMGLKPGSFVEWKIQGQQVIVTRVTKCSTLDVHSALFPKDKAALSQVKNTQVKNMSDLKEGIRERMRRRYARD
jgi:antitoxin PrlF